MIKHTGFCLGDFELSKCHDCPTMEECLELRRSDLSAEINEIDSILEAKNINRVVRNLGGMFT
jgi:hypothetical protein